MNESFSQDEREAIRGARNAVFEDRIILDTQPPIEDDALSEIAKRCLARGATVDEHAVFSAVDAGRADTAFVLLEAMGPADSLQLAIRARQRAADAEQSARRIEAGTLASSLSAADLRDRAARLRELADRVDPTIKGVGS